MRLSNKAYSLLDIVDISMLVIYSEGRENVFRRLNYEYRLNSHKLYIIVNIELSLFKIIGY